MTLAPGTRIGPYEVASALGAGGMGEVYRAKDTRLNREVAIKVLPAAMAGNAQALHRMEQEARAIAALNHPNLLSVYDIGQTAEGLPYIVSELLEGEPLRTRLAGGALDVRKAVDYATQMAHGLAAAHDKGIVHRDLKPDNIFLTSDGRVKILDFGLAKLTAAAASEDVTEMAPATQPGLVLGTVGYMAPEQVRGQAVDARSDIFSFGAVLYEMLAGKRAFRGASAADVMSAILREEPEPLTGITTATGKPRELPPALERIVRHCLEKEPRQRFQSAGDIAFALGDLSQATSTALPAAKPRGRNWALPLVSAGLIFFAAAFLWLLVRAGRASPPTLLRASYHAGRINGARFLPGGQDFVVSGAWDNALRSTLYQGRTPSSAASLPGLVALALDHGYVAAVSPSGEIAILAANPGHSSPSVLSVIPAGGGAPRPLMRNIESAAFPPSGSGLAVARISTVTGETTLEYPAGHVLYRIAGGGGWCGDLRFSPDGKTLAFLDHPTYNDNRGAVAVVDLQGHERTLSRMFSSTNGLAWSPDGHEVWFTAGTGGNNELLAVDLKGRQRRLWQGPSHAMLDDVLPDGRVLLTSTQNRSFARVASVQDLEGQNYTIRSRSNRLVLSDDGKKALVEESAGAGQNYDTYLRTVGADSADLLGQGVPLALSPDGQWALTWLASPSQLELLPAGPGEARQLTHGKLTFLVSRARFLPDGSGVIAIAAPLGQTFRTYLVGLNGDIKPVTPPGTTAVCLTPDGKQMLVGDTKGQWALYPLAGGEPSPVTAIQPGEQPLRFGESAGQLYVTTASGLSASIFSLDLRSGKRTLIATVRPPDAAGASPARVESISRDGKTFAYGYSSTLSTLYVVSGLH